MKRLLLGFLAAAALVAWLGGIGPFAPASEDEAEGGADERALLEGDASEDDAHIEEQVDVVRAAIQAGLERGLRERKGIFSG